MAAGRWHNRGAAIIYTAESAAGALTELLVHLDRASVSAEFKLIRLRIPPTVKIGQVTGLKPQWQNDLAYSRNIGDTWLRENSSLALRVPSAIIADSHNVIINPRHFDVASLVIEEVQSVPFDSRLI